MQTSKYQDLFRCKSISKSISQISTSNFQNYEVVNFDFMLENLRYEIQYYITHKLVN